MINKSQTQTVLILAPHTDDGELGCGGTICKLLEEGATMHYIAFSICETSVPEPFPRDTLAVEMKNATAVLGIPAQNTTSLRYAVRTFSQYRQGILDDLIRLQQQLQPDIVFLPTSDDIHQDHQVIHNEGVRAFKHSSILGYELPWNHVQFHGNAFFALEDQHITRKIKALEMYKSQVSRDYFDETYLRGLARIRGQQIKTKWAEAFQVIRWITR